MNYRHGFHAGNHADVLKHWVLTLCLDRLAQKPGPFAMLDTHAGRGRYDLDDDAARRSPEWRDGIGRLRDWAEAPDPLQSYLQAVAAFGPNRYPGSPALALHRMRPQDRFVGCELHPVEVAALRGALAGDPRAQIHHRDGYAALAGLTPFPERRGLILIDPPYERDDDTARSLDALKSLLSRFSHAVVLLWRPLKSGGGAARFDAELIAFGRPMVRIDLATADPTATPRLAASGLLLVNPPFGVAESVVAAGPALAARLAVGPGAALTVSRLGRNSD